MKRYLSLALCVLALCTSVTAASGLAGLKSVVVPMRGVSADVVLAQGSISRDQSAGELIAAASAKGKLLLAVNGGFFNAYYGKSPEEGYGKAPRCQVSLVRDGMVINGGAGDQTAVYLGFTADGRALIDEVGVTLYVEHNGKKLPTWGVNCYYPEPDSLLLFTPEAGADLPVPANAKVAKIVDGKVVELLDSGKMICTPGTYYFVCGKNLHDRLPAVGDSVGFTTEFDKPSWQNVTTAVSCGPWLLHDGKNVFSENAKYPYLSEQKVSETAVAQRTVAAVMANGDLMVGTCTASPRQITEYLLSAGATDAMLLDGGASSMLWSNGSMVTSPGRKLNNILCLYESAASAPAVSVTVDGAPIRWTDAAPFIDGAGRTMVPLRPVGEALGLRVTWDAEKREAGFSDGEKAIYFPIDSRSARTGDGRTIAMDTAAVIRDGRTYAPVRCLAEFFGRSVGWDAASRTVVIQ